MAIPPQELIDRLVAFENDLADFYDNLLLNNDLAPLAKLCRFMSQHSRIHAQLIANYREDAQIPQLNANPLEHLHERLKTNLREELGDETKVAEAARKLSQAEEIVGQAYARIADHYTSVSETYQKIAAKFHALAKDERDHRDYILREQQRMATAPPATAEKGDE